MIAIQTAPNVYSHPKTRLRISWHCAFALHSDRLRNHGGLAFSWERGHCADGKHRRDYLRALFFNRSVRAIKRGPLQSCGISRTINPRRSSAHQLDSLHLRTTARGYFRSLARASDVRSASVSDQCKAPDRAWSVGCGGCRNCRSTAGDPPSTSSQSRLLNCGLHRSGLLVHSVDFLCQSSRCGCANVFGHLRRDRSQLCAWVCRVAVVRHGARLVSKQPPGAQPPNGCRVKPSNLRKVRPYSEYQHQFKPQSPRLRIIPNKCPPSLIPFQKSVSMCCEPLRIHQGCLLRRHSWTESFAFVSSESLSATIFRLYRSTSPSFERLAS